MTDFLYINTPIVAFGLCVVIALLWRALEDKRKCSKYLLKGINERAKDCAELLGRVNKLEREIKRLNENQNGFRHPETGLFVKESEYWKAVLK